MIIKQLNESHVNAVRSLFDITKHMGVEHSREYFVPDDMKFSKVMHDTFCDTYLSGLNNFKAFGSIEDDKVSSYIAFYESTESAEWYWTQVRSSSATSIPFVLDKVMEHNESHGRLKFYSMFNSKYANSYRRLSFSDTAKERYGFFDEFIVPEKTKCFYQIPWQLLFNRTLVPVESLVRCSFLKQEYRTTLPISGGL